MGPFILGESPYALFFIFFLSTQYSFPVFSDFFGAGFANGEVLVFFGDGLFAKAAKTI